MCGHLTASVLAALGEQGDVAGDAAVRGEHAHTVLAALRELPEEQRTVIVLAYFAGMSQSQIAEHLGIPLGTVKKRVRLAMQKLRDALAADRSEGTRLRMVRDR
jgi:RNA polymerase sigma factor (sigma-70 family)